MFAGALFVSLPLLSSPQLYNPYVFWISLGLMRYVGIINPILNIRKPRLQEIK